MMFLQIIIRTCVQSSTWWVRTRNELTHFFLGGTYTKTLTWPLIILIDMHWWDLNTKSYAFFSYQEYLLTCIGWTLTQNLMAFFSYQEYLLTCIGGTLTKSYGIFQLSRILIDMHWWDLNTKSLWHFSATKNTY